MENNLNINEDYTIVQASQILNVSLRTIHNYIKKGMLKATKWNGIWFVENRSIMELKMKINRTKMEISRLEKGSERRSERPHETKFWVDKEHYEDLLKQVGQLRAAESLLIEYKSQNQELLEKIRELEREVDRLTLEGQKRGFWKRIRRRKKAEGRKGEVGA